MPKKGDEFHRIVTSIERIFQNSPGTKVLSPSYIPDRTTNSKREHDILVTHTLGNENIKMAIECKDLSRKVAVPIIEAFHTKLNDTHCNKGVIVSSRGFTKAAVYKARHYNISCLTLSEVEQFSWILTNSIESTSFAITSGFIKILIDEDAPKNPRLFQIMQNEDILIENEGCWNLIRNAFNNVTRQSSSGAHNIIIKVLNQQDFYVECDLGRLDVRDMRIEIQYEVKIERIPISFKSYSRGDDSKKTSYIGIAPVRKSVDQDPYGDIVIQQGGIYFVPHPKKKLDLDST